jgi:hypothetical protein
MNTGFSTFPDFYLPSFLPTLEAVIARMVACQQTATIHFLVDPASLKM